MSAARLGSFFTGLRTCANIIPILTTGCTSIFLLVVMAAYHTHHGPLASRILFDTAHYLACIFPNAIILYVIFSANDTSLTVILVSTPPLCLLSWLTGRWLALGIARWGGIRALIVYAVVSGVTYKGVWLICSAFPCFCMPWLCKLLDLH